MIPSVDAATARRLANEILGTAESRVEPIDVGFANQNWHVTSRSENYVLKIGPATSASKWSAAAVGRTIARECGLAVPTVRYEDVVDGRCVRLLDWVDGQTARSLTDRPDAQTRLGAQLGYAIAALHSHKLEWFGSRLDGSVPTFPAWGRYLLHRVEQIQQRARGNAVRDVELLDRAALAVEDVAYGIDHACRAVVCHRDLHVDNLIVDSSGSLLAVIDWDMPEAWDSAGEWFKLDTMLFADLPDTCGAFEDAYFAVHADEERWQERVWLVHMIENMNVVANEPGQNADFTNAAVARLGLLMDVTR